MKRTVLLLSLTVSLAAKVTSADPPELDRLRESYRTAMEKAAKPINETYLSELMKIRDEYTRASNLDAANKVQAEIESIANQIDPAVNAPESQVTIPANDFNGYRIGALKMGDIITLSYVSGKWKTDGKIASDNPDAAFTERGNATRLAVTNGRYKSKPGTVLVVVPAGTTIQPFSYTLPEDIENVVLRINEDTNDYESNPGMVTYKLQISRRE